MGRIFKQTVVSEGYGNLNSASSTGALLLNSNVHIVLNILQIVNVFQDVFYICFI